MKNRQVLTLLHHLNQSQTLSAEDCSKLLGISVSSLKKEMTSLKAMLEKHGCKLVGKRGQGNGYELQIIDQALYEEYISKVLPNLVEQESSNFNEQKNRVRFLVEFLLEQSDFIKAESLAEDMAISRSQFNKDLNLTKKILHSYNVTLTNKPYHGLHVEGSERDVRLCLANTYMENWAICDEKHIYLQSGDSEHSFEKIRAVIVNAAKDHHYPLSDLLIENLTLHIFIAVKRVDSGNEIQLNERIKAELLDSKEYPLALQIAHEVEDIYHISFSETEICYIIMHLSSKRMIGDDFLINEEVIDIVDEMLQRIKERYYIDLISNLDLRIMLGMHTMPLLKRIEFGMRLKNPVLDEIKNNLVFAYEVALCACSVINERYHCSLSSDEVGYYAMHFKVAMDGLREQKKKNILLVCSSGRGSAQLLKYDVLKRFSHEIERLETCNVFELEQMDLSQFDCILTTVSLNIHIPIPVFKIKLFFDEESEQTMERIFAIDRREARLQSYFNQALFHKDIEGESKEEIIAHIVDKIEEKRSLSKGFYDAVMRRESLEDTQLSAYIAMPHPDRVIGDEEIISLNILKKPVTWGRGSVQVVLLISFSKQFVRQNELFFEFISEFMKNKQQINRLIDNPSYETLKNIIHEMSREGE